MILHSTPGSSCSASFRRRFRRPLVCGVVNPKLLARLAIGSLTSVHDFFAYVYEQCHMLRYPSIQRILRAFFEYCHSLLVYLLHFSHHERLT